MFHTRNLLLAALVVVIAAGCSVAPKVEQPEPPTGPFDVAILAVTDTRGELEPCG